jgi:hypothetical protein
MNGVRKMFTIEASKKNDLTKILWCVEMFGEDFKFEEPMQFTFKKHNQLLLFKIAFGD